MSEPIDIRFDNAEVARRIGHLMLTLWEREATIAALGRRVDELDPPAPAETPGA